MCMSKDVDTGEDQDLHQDQSDSMLADTKSLYNQPFLYEHKTRVVSRHWMQTLNSCRIDQIGADFSMIVKKDHTERINNGIFIHDIAR